MLSCVRSLTELPVEAVRAAEGRQCVSQTRNAGIGICLLADHLDDLARVAGPRCYPALDHSISTVSVLCKPLTHTDDSVMLLSAHSAWDAWCDRVASHTTEG